VLGAGGSADVELVSCQVEGAPSLLLPIPMSLLYTPSVDNS